jgi:hypothetical protein
VAAPGFQGSFAGCSCESKDTASANRCRPLNADFVAASHRLDASALRPHCART